MNKEIQISFNQKEIETIVKSVIGGGQVSFSEALPIFHKLIEAGVPLVIGGKEYNIQKQEPID